MRNLFSTFSILRIRTGRGTWFLRAPWNEPLFSERYGYQRIVWRLWGWRLTFRPKDEIGA